MCGWARAVDEFTPMNTRPPPAVGLVKCVTEPTEVENRTLPVVGLGQCWAQPNHAVAVVEGGGRGSVAGGDIQAPGPVYGGARRGPKPGLVLAAGLVHIGDRGRRVVGLRSNHVTVIGPAVPGQAAVRDVDHA